MSLLEFRCRHHFAGGLRVDGGFHLDLAFRTDRRFNTVFGPSGAGKTTILSIIAGFLRPDEGFVSLGGRVLLDTSRRRFVAPRNRSVGVVFQEGLLFPHLSVESNLRYGLRRRRGRRREVDFRRVVDVLEVGRLLARFPRNLSGGEKQRVGLGRALLSGPELLLMDEPMASLDAPLRSRILAYLQRAVQEWDIPAIYVSHSQAEVRRAADWVAVVEKGRLVTVGAPDEALGQPEPLGWANPAGPVNLLRLDRVELSAGQLTGWIGGQMLSLPPLAPDAAPPRFVQFSPADVFLSRRDVEGLSARNHLRGRVCRLASGNQAVFVAVDIGQILWAEITPAAAADLQLRPGVEVFCLLKTHGLSLAE